MGKQVKKVSKYWAPWCKPCLDYNKIFEEVKELYGDKLEFEEIDITKDESNALVEKYKVQSIPTTIFQFTDLSETVVPGQIPLEYLKKILDGTVQLDNVESIKNNLK